MVLTPQGKISHYFYGIEYSAKDLRLGLVEAADGKIGSRVDQLLLYCYHYDPATGKFAWVINLYRWGGALTVVAIIGLLLFLRRPRRSVEELKAGGTA
jgi:protein SCO1/2